MDKYFGLHLDDVGLNVRAVKLVQLLQCPCAVTCEVAGVGGNGGTTNHENEPETAAGSLLVHDLSLVCGGDHLWVQPRVRPLARGHTPE